MTGLEPLHGVFAYLRYKGVLYEWQAPNSIFSLLKQAEDASKKGNLEQVLTPEIFHQLEKNCRPHEQAPSALFEVSELKASLAFLVIDFDTQWIAWMLPSTHTPLQTYHIANWTTHNFLEDPNGLSAEGEILGLRAFLMEAFEHNFGSFLNQSQWVDFFKQWQALLQGMVYLEKPMEIETLFIEHERHILEQSLPNSSKTHSSKFI